MPAARWARSWPPCWWPTSAGPAPTSSPPPRSSSHSSCRRSSRSRRSSRARALRLGERLRALQTAWAHHRESRRKEKLRREVIRKHTTAKDGIGGLPRIRRVKAGGEAAEEEEADPLADDDLPLNAPLPPRAGAAGPAQKPLPFAAPLAEEEESPRPRPSPRRRRPADAVGEVRGDHTLPPITLLDDAKGSLIVDNDRLLEKGRILQAKCSEFGVMGTVKEIHPGPVVTTYEFKPDAGVKYSKIVGLADDLALALEAESIRIDRVSGKGNVGIEIPNEKRETIYLRELLESDAFRRSSGRLTLAPGQGGQRRPLRHRPRGHAPPPDRRLHRHRARAWASTA